VRTSRQAEKRTGQKGHKNGHENVPFWVLDGFSEIGLSLLERMAETTRLELATSAVTGTTSHWKYIAGNVIGYRDVYRGGRRYGIRCSGLFPNGGCKVFWPFHCWCHFRTSPMSPKAIIASTTAVIRFVPCHFNSFSMAAACPFVGFSLTAVW
jgi:hypothetical protein